MWKYIPCRDIAHCHSEPCVAHVCSWSIAELAYVLIVFWYSHWQDPRRELRRLLTLSLINHHEPQKITMFTKHLRNMYQLGMPANILGLIGID